MRKKPGENLPTMYLLTKVTMFNFRRGNECAAMQLDKFIQRADWSMITKASSGCFSLVNILN